MALVCAVGLSACSLDKPTVPALVGPSELGLSITMTASPDILAQDGRSQSVIDITALDYLSQPVRGLVINLQTAVGGAAADFGTLSAKTVSTNIDGRATVTYTSPAAPPPTVTSDETVAIMAVPTGTNFANAQSHQVLIHLLRPGVVLPPNGAPTPNFFFSPSSAREHDDVIFDGTGSVDGDGTIVSYSWNFGDGDSGTGARVTHAFDVAGSYNVVLTVTDDRGMSASSAPKVVTIGAAAVPTADFAISPTTPGVNTSVSFNASASTAITGRRIVDYEFDFGDGAPHAHGVTASHTYTLPGSYSVTLTVTDDAGRTGVATKVLSVNGNGGTANFTMSPTAAQAGHPVSFDASSSTVPPGRTITNYFWDFGEPVSRQTASGKTVTFTYPSAGTFTVTLTITDNTGATAVVSKTITVSP